MMKRLWNSLKSFGCGNKNELKDQVEKLLFQIQELKAIHHYQAFDLEKKINELQTKLDMRNCAIEIHEQDNQLLKKEISELEIKSNYSHDHMVDLVKENSSLKKKIATCKAEIQE
jgi:chromosome segregation ATPase